MSDEDLINNLSIDLRNKLADVIKGHQPVVVEKALALCVAAHMTVYRTDDPEKTRKLRVQMLMLFTGMVSKLVPVIEHMAKKVN